MHNSRVRALLIRAPQCVGAFLLLSLSLLFSGCNEKSHTPEWKQPGAADEAPKVPTTQEAPPSSRTPTSQPVTQPLSNGSDEELRFLSYNIKNYLTMSRYVDGERKDRRKPAREVDALVDIIIAARPDVLGICEIGTVEDLAELQKKLIDGGLTLAHSEHAGGADTTRQLGLLSRYPIVATDSQGADGSLTYSSVDADNRPKEFAMQRGILDATVAAGSQKIRFLGVHLKSKREVPYGHQDLMRRHEAYLLRKHADRILEKAPETLLCVYGDLNDTRRESPVRSIQGPTQSSRYLEPLHHTDSRGHVWTHYWEYQQVYSRFDYVLASRSLRPLFNQKESYIIDSPSWSKASDHRALVSIFKLKR